MDGFDYDIELGDIDEVDEEEDSYHESVEKQDAKEEQEQQEDDIEIDEIRTVEGDDEERRIEVLKLFLAKIQSMESLFDSDDVDAIEREIRKMESSKKRIWKKQARERLKVLSEFERILEMKRYHKHLSDFFVNKHIKQQRMIASLR